MFSFETERYLLEAVGSNSWRIVDKELNKTTPIDRSTGNYVIMKEMYDNRREAFEATCKSLIDCCGTYNDKIKV